MNEATTQIARGKNPETVCPVCGTNLSVAGPSWRYRCSSCRTERSRFPALSGDGVFDRSMHEAAHEGMRRRIYRRIIKKMVAGLSDQRRGTLLDIGCSYGWFLEEARSVGFSVVGLEPDEEFVAAARARGFEIIHGTFPEAMAEDQHFNAICFNDVFEHLDDPRRAMGACHRSLRDGGVLMINIPSSDGLLYRVANVASRLGVLAPIERLWLKDWPFPHRTFFTSKSLVALATEMKFECEQRSRLPLYEVRGLRERLSIDASLSRLSVWIIWAGLVVLIPVQRLFASDINVFLFRKQQISGQEQAPQS